ncbi:hypothetical protein CPB85DRAFT_917114 [Mucidula mucida]|nr:hypothetical protein CPB85DRAFT_917114 [Mucidula mucida]
MRTMVFFFEVVVVVEEQSARKALLYAPMIIGDRFNLRHRLHLKTKFEGLRLLHLLEWKIALYFCFLVGSKPSIMDPTSSGGASIFLVCIFVCGRTGSVTAALGGASFVLDRIHQSTACELATHVLYAAPNTPTPTFTTASSGIRTIRATRPRQPFTHTIRIKSTLLTHWAGIPDICHLSRQRRT